MKIPYDNSFFVRSNVTLAVKCGKSFALEEFQRNGYDVGSTVRVIPSEKTLLTWARALLYPIEPTNPSDDPRDLPWKMYPRVVRALERERERERGSGVQRNRFERKSHRKSFFPVTIIFHFCSSRLGGKEIGPLYCVRLRSSSTSNTHPLTHS